MATGGLVLFVLSTFSTSLRLVWPDLSFIESHGGQLIRLHTAGTYSNVQLFLLHFTASDVDSSSVRLVFPLTLIQSRCFFIRPYSGHSICGRSP